MVDRKDKRFFDFMCSCGDEKAAQCDKVYEDVKKSLGDDVTDKFFTTAIVYGLSLMDNGIANIEHIYTDMWCGIAINYEYDYQEVLECEDEKDNQVKDCKCDKESGYDCQWTVQKFWIECDEIHHGLARAYQLVEEFDKTLT